MNSVLKQYFNNYREAIFSANISFFHTFSSILSFSYIFLLPNATGFVVAAIFMLFNLKIIINIFIKTKLCFVKKCSLVIALILDSIFIQLPNLILSTGFSCNQPIDLLHINETISYQAILTKIQILVAKIKLPFNLVCQENYTSKIYFKW